jgi:hypothetical protein
MIYIPLTVVRVWVTVVLEEPFLEWRSNYEGRLKSSWTHLIRKSPSPHLHKIPTRSNKVLHLGTLSRCVLTILLGVGTLWSWSDGLFFEYGESTNFSDGPLIIYNIKPFCISYFRPSCLIVARKPCKVQCMKRSMSTAALLLQKYTRFNPWLDLSPWTPRRWIMENLEEVK